MCINFIGNKIDTSELGDENKTTPSTLELEPVYVEDHRLKHLFGMVLNSCTTQEYEIETPWKTLTILTWVEYICVIGCRYSGQILQIAWQFSEQGALEWLYFAIGFNVGNESSASMYFVDFCFVIEPRTWYFQLAPFEWI